MLQEEEGLPLVWCFIDDVGICRACILRQYIFCVRREREGIVYALWFFIHKVITQKENV